MNYSSVHLILIEHIGADANIANIGVACVVDRVLDVDNMRALIAGELVEVYDDMARVHINRALFVSKGAVLLKCVVSNQY